MAPPRRLAAITMCLEFGADIHQVNGAGDSSCAPGHSQLDPRLPTSSHASRGTRRQIRLEEQNRAALPPLDVALRAREKEP